MKAHSIRAAWLLASVLLVQCGCTESSTEKKPAAVPLEPQAAQSAASQPGTPATPQPATSAAPKAVEEKKAEGAAAALAPLPPEKLPPRTRPAPDPEKEQFQLEKVNVKIAERIQPKEKPAYEPKVRIIEQYLSEYFRRAGYQVVEPPAARYRIEGSFEAGFVDAFTLQGQTIAHRYKGNLRLEVKEGDSSTPLETVEIPEFLKDGPQKEGVPEEEIAVRDMRRHLARVVWERLHSDGKVFADREIPALISSLAADDSELEPPVEADEVVKKLVEMRFHAVPYLLEALGDEREVRVNAHYPGHTSAASRKLRIYHLADKALEEIFQKVSRMDLETVPEMRSKIVRGWENEWMRFCPPFRDSPQRGHQKPQAASAETKSATG
jgi:hypothetical protein